jgi:hypothetical protein
MTARRLPVASAPAATTPATWRYRAPHIGSQTTDVWLTAVLKSKADNDEVPLTAWWFVATSLESAVSIRRSLERVEPLPHEAFEQAARGSQKTARAALEEIEEHHGRRFVAPEPVPLHIDPLSILRCTILQLARLTVRSQGTPAEQLSSRLFAHIDGLSRCLAQRSSATDGVASVVSAGVMTGAVRRRAAQM